MLTTFRKFIEAATNAYYFDRASTPEKRLESFLAAMEDVTAMTITPVDDAIFNYLKTSATVPECRASLSQVLEALYPPKEGE